MLDAHRSSALSVLWIGALSLAACSAPGQPVDVVVRDVTVIDASNGVREHQSVAVDGGRIVSVGDAADMEAFEGAETVEGTGRYLIPGLWDFHVHFTYDARLTDAMPGLFLHHGITSVRDTGGPLDRILPVVERLRAEGAVGPRVFFAGPLLDGRDVVYDGDNRPLLGIANPDPATARANVARLAAAGVDFLKIYEMVSPEVFRTLVEEGHARGLPLDGHVPLSMPAREVAPEMQSLEHLRNLEMDCAAGRDTLLAERRRLLQNPEGLEGAALRSRLHGLQRLAAIADYDEGECSEMVEALGSTIQVPTLRLNSQSLSSPFDRPDWDEVLTKLPPDVAAEWGAAAEEAGRSSELPDTTFAAWSLFLVGLLDDAGVPIGAGTDTPIGFSPPGYSLHSELEMLVRAGLTPMEALEAATVRPAEFFGREDDMGTVEEGRLADLVLLSADPLDDIRNTRAIEGVVSKGVWWDREALDGLVR